MRPHPDRSIGPNLRFSAGGSDAFRVLNDSGRRANRKPAVLVSYVFAKGLAKKKMFLDDWMLDSGAFSAHNSGVHIDLHDYIAFAKDLAAKDPTLVEVVALDVIGDWRASIKNTEIMWKAGLKAIPTYHYSEPADVLLGIARDYPKIAIGGAVALRGSTKSNWIAQCFARVWPKAIHGFGVSDEPTCLSFPWSSVDSSTWALAPAAFGHWRWMTGRQRAPHIPAKGRPSVFPEMEYYFKLESKMVGLWAKELVKLPYRTGSVLV